MERKIRVLVGKPGLDGHDRGAKVVAAALRDAGMEVIYTGLHQTPEQIVEAAIQEDVDVVALSVLSGAHMTLFPEVMKLMKRRGVGDRLLTGGGIIPPEDMEALAKLGVGRLFGPGTSTQEIGAYIREWFGARQGGPGEAKATRAGTPKPGSALKSKPKSRPKSKSKSRPKSKSKSKSKSRPKSGERSARTRRAAVPRRPAKKR